MTPPPPAARSARSWIGSLFVSAAVVAAAGILGSTGAYWVRVRYREPTISVTGSSTRRIRSDRVLWSAEVVARADTLAEAFRILKSGTPRVKQFLMGRGLSAEEVTVGSIRTEELYARNDDGIQIRERVIGYALRQPVAVTSANIPLVTRVSQEVTELIQDGVDVRSETPEYIYTGLGALKVQLIAEATKDARNRATRVARNTGTRLGTLASARVGVVQVNAANESEVSWDGVYDRRAIEKDAMVAVTTVFTVE